MTRLRALWNPITKSNARLRSWARWNDEYVAESRKLHPDAVIACDLDTLDAGVRLKRESGCVLVYDMHELWTEQRYHHYLTIYHKWLMRRRETKLLRHADMVTTVSKRFATEINGRLPAANPLVVYSGTDSCSTGAPLDRERLRVYFQGSFTDDRGLEDVVEAMVYVRDRATLTLQGFGPLEGELRELAGNLGLLGDVVRFIPPCAPADVGKSASEYDIGLVAGTLKSINAKLTTPNRVFAYAGGGLAIITPADLEEVADMVAEYEFGLTFRGAGPRPLADVIAYLADNPDVMVRMKANASNACTAFLWDHQFGPVSDFIVESLRVRGVLFSLSGEPAGPSDEGH